MLTHELIYNLGISDSYDPLNIFEISIRMRRNKYLTLGTDNQMRRNRNLTLGTDNEKTSLENTTSIIKISCNRPTGLSNLAHKDFRIYLSQLKTLGKFSLKKGEMIWNFKYHTNVKANQGKIDNMTDLQIFTGNRTLSVFEETSKSIAESKNLKVFKSYNLDSTSIVNLLMKHQFSEVPLTEVGRITKNIMKLKNSYVEYININPGVWNESVHDCIRSCNKLLKHEKKHLEKELTFFSKESAPFDGSKNPPKVIMFD